MGKNRVIIIEDDQELGDLVRIYVAREGIEASLCGSAEAGLALFRSIGADLIVLDINLPGMDGFAFLQVLRRESFIPVIIISARESDEDIVMGLGIGADEFVTKPFVPRVLVARISAMLRRGGTTTPKRVSFDSYVLDYEGYTLTRDGRRITLSTREFELLRHLVTHPGVAMTPDDIYKQVWGSMYGDLTAVAVYIRRLRQKIEEDPASPRYLQTIHGRGYRFNPDAVKG
ncbi:MAG: response regulator transcription factor [Spirochaetia bacterium]|jgi:two-component system response regulator RegX3